MSKEDPHLIFCEFERTLNIGSTAVQTIVHNYLRFIKRRLLHATFPDRKLKGGEGGLGLFDARKIQWRAVQRHLQYHHRWWNMDLPLWPWKEEVVFCVALSSGETTHKNSTKSELGKENGGNFFKWKSFVTLNTSRTTVRLWLILNGTWIIVFPHSLPQGSYSTQSPRMDTFCGISTMHLHTRLPERWTFWRRRKCECHLTSPIHLTWSHVTSFCSLRPGLGLDCGRTRGKVYLKAPFYQFEENFFRITINTLKF